MGRFRSGRLPVVAEDKLNLAILRTIRPDHEEAETVLGRRLFNSVYQRSPAAMGETGTASILLVVVVCGLTNHYDKTTYAALVDLIRACTRSG